MFNTSKKKYLDFLDAFFESDKFKNTSIEELKATMYVAQKKYKNGWENDLEVPVKEIIEKCNLPKDVRVYQRRDSNWAELQRS